MKERISELMKQHSLNQKQLSIKAGVTESAMSHYLNGDRIPRMAVLGRIAEALNTSVDYLVNGDTDAVLSDKDQALRLIARSASHMTYEEKRKIMDILFSEED